MANAKSAASAAVAKAKAAAEKAKAATATKAAAAPKEQPAAEQPKFTELHHMLCKVVGGKKNKGETVKVFLASSKKNRFGGLTARAETADGEKIWLDQKHLEVVGKMDAKDVKRLDAERDAENNETLYIAANIGIEKDNAVRLDYPGWFKKLWFPKTMITDTGATLADAAKTPIYEIVAWKVKREVGMDSYNVLKDKQADLEKIVNAG